MNYQKLKVLQIMHEGNQHLQKMSRAHSKLKDLIPLNLDRYQNLTEDQIAYIDQFLFRFASLQDTMGENLFKTLLVLQGEPVKTKTFIDILNRLEELNLLSKEQWIFLRELRNKATHEYPKTEAEVVMNLNQLFQSAQIIYQVFINIQAFIFERNSFEDINLSPYLLKTGFESIE